MAARSIASLTLSFGLVNIPVKLYSATESSSSIHFNMLDADGSRVKQQYVSEKTGKVVERSQMIKGYEFEKDHFVMFTPAELKALDEEASHVIDIVAFVPEKSVDPIFYDRAYFLAPDKRGGKPYALLLEAMRQSGRCALARWTSKGKQYVVQVRAAEDGIVLQQLLYAEEVRSMKDLDIEQVAVSQAELGLALQLIDQITQPGYDPQAFKDEEKARVLEAIDRKVVGKQVVASSRAEEPAATGQVIDLVEALRASLGRGKPANDARASEGGTSRTTGKVVAATRAASPVAQPRSGAEIVPVEALKERKPVKRAPKADDRAAAPADVAAAVAPAPMAANARSRSRK